MQTEMVESFSTGKVLEGVGWGEVGRGHKQGASLAMREELLWLGACSCVSVLSVMQTARLVLSEDTHEPGGILNKKHWGQGLQSSTCTLDLSFCLSVYCASSTAPRKLGSRR